MKIVCIDNYGRETYADRLVAENVQNEDEAALIARALNDDPGKSRDDYFVVRPDNYVLHEWRP